MESLPDAVIMAGGLGTRLRPITEKMPKVLVSVAQRPIIDWILDWISDQGVARALLLVAYLGEQVESHLGSRFGDLRLEYGYEEEPLGTGGGLVNSIDLLPGRFFLVWGDDYYPLDYRPLLETHNSSRRLMTMSVYSDPLLPGGASTPFNVEVQDGTILRYDKSNPDRAGLNGIQAGTDLLERTLFESINYPPGPWSLEEHAYPQLIAAGQVAVHPDQTPYHDMGTAEGRANLDRILRGR